MKNLVVCVIGIVLCAVPIAQASLVVHEPFSDYTPGALKDQFPNTKTVGLDKAYKYAGAAGTIFAVQNTGLSFSDLKVTGGSLAITSTGNPNTVSTKFSVAPVTGDLFASYLVNINQFSVTAAAGGTAVSVGNNVGGVQSTGLFNMFADVSGGNNVKSGVSYGSGAGQAATTGLTAGTTYLLLARFTNVGLPLAANPNPGARGYAYLWALDEDQYDYLKADGTVTEAELNAASVGTGVGSVTVKVNTNVSSGTIPFDNTKFLTITGWGTAAAPEKATVDEIRYGTTLADVIPVPEPATLVLLGMGVLGLLRRRRA